MNSLLHGGGKSSIQGLYATHSDFCRIFNEDMSGLHLLALMLTADGAAAEQCFVAGFEDSVISNRVFKQWAHSWSKRAIIKNAIRMVRPLPSAAKDATSSRNVEAGPTINASLAAVFRLQPFERFVLVMSLLEGYSSQDCATLLNCTRQEVIASRNLALQQLARVEMNSQTAEAVSKLLPTDEPLPIGGAA